MKLIIKNMVCPRCIAAVSALLADEGLTTTAVRLGEVEIVETLGKEQKMHLSASLREAGFELLDEPRAQVVEQLRIAVMEWVHIEGERPNLTDYLPRRLGKDYSALSKLFSEVEGVTLERFAILHRIEYAKELLCYQQQTMSEIAYLLGYSSPAHLSAQFKQVTGMTPKAFREQGTRHGVLSIYSSNQPH